MDDEEKLSALTCVELRRRLDERGLAAPRLKKEMIALLLSSQPSQPKEEKEAEEKKEEEAAPGEETAKKEAPRVLKGLSAAAALAPKKRAREWSLSAAASAPITSDTLREITASSSSATAATAAASEEKAAEAPPKEPAVAADSGCGNTLFVEHFVRPFTLQQVRRLVEAHGAVTRLWMNSIKTHAYVSFADPAAAAAARAALDGLAWPPANGGKLAAAFCSEEDAVRAMESGGTDAPGQLRRLAEPLIQPRAPKQQQQQQQQKAEKEEQPAEKKQKKKEEEEEEMDTTTKQKKVAEKKKEEETRTLDELFRKTTSKPHVYFLPLTEEQAAVRAK